MEAEKLELSERIERRLEMIHAHTKHGKTVRSVIEEFNVSLGTYYYWYPRYVEIYGVILGLDFVSSNRCIGMIISRNNHFLPLTDSTLSVIM